MFTIALLNNVLVCESPKCWGSPDKMMSVGPSSSGAPGPQELGGDREAPSMVMCSLAGLLSGDLRPKSFPTIPWGLRPAAPAAGQDPVGAGGEGSGLTRRMYFISFLLPF